MFSQIAYLGSGVVLIILFLFPLAINGEETKLKEKADQIYQLDEKVQLKEKELLILQEAEYQARRENKFELAYELKQKVAKLENELKDLKNELENLLEEYENDWLARPWWQRLALESSLSYTHFDRSLDIENAYGVKFKIHLVKQEFQHFHPGSYLYYPRERGENYPLRRIETSSFIIEYHQIETQLSYPEPDQPEAVEIHSYLAGFGFLGQLWGNTYIKLNLSTGLQSYIGTKPNDTGFIIGYTLGMAQKLSAKWAAGLDLTGEAVFTCANQEQTRPTFNFSASFVLRFSF